MYNVGNMAEDVQERRATDMRKRMGEVLVVVKAETLAIIYKSIQGGIEAFAKTPTRTSTDPVAARATQQLKETIDAEHQQAMVTHFLDFYREQEQNPLLDGIEFNSQVYGLNPNEPRKGKTVVNWEDLPKTLGFEKFLVKK